MRKKLWTTFLITLLTGVFIFLLRLDAIYSQPEMCQIDFTPERKYINEVQKFNNSKTYKVKITDVPYTDDFTFDLIEEEDQWRMVIVLSSIDNAISQYKEGLIDEVIENIYLVKNLVNIKDNIDCLGYYCPRINSIYINTNYFSTKAIHHEIFHAITNKKNLPVSFHTKFNGMNDCAYISSYACKAYREQLAEAWAYSLTTDKDNYKIKTVKQELYPIFLKENWIN